MSVLVGATWGIGGATLAVCLAYALGLCMVCAGFSCVSFSPNCVGVIWGGNLGVLCACVYS